MMCDGSRACIPTHRTTVQLSAVNLYRNAKHSIKGRIGRPVRRYPALPLLPKRRTGAGHAGARRDAELELPREGRGTHVGGRSLHPETGAPPFLTSSAGYYADHVTDGAKPDGERDAGSDRAASALVQGRRGLRVGRQREST